MTPPNSYVFFIIHYNVYIKNSSCKMVSPALQPIQQNADSTCDSSSSLFLTDFSSLVLSYTTLPHLTQHTGTILHYTVPSLCPVLLNCCKTKYHFSAFQHCLLDGWTDDTVCGRGIFSTRNQLVGKSAHCV